MLAGIFPSSVAVLSAAALATGSASHTLTYDQARAALRAVGVTKVFTYGSPRDSAGEIINVINGPIASQPLIVRVFPSAKALHTFNAKNPPPSTALLHTVLPRAGGYLPDRLVCNVLIGSTVLPWLNTDHPTAAERSELHRLLVKIAAAQVRVVDYLQARCTP